MKSFVAVIVTAAGLTTTAASAAPLNFTFSFVNSANGGGIVAGIVRGLVDDTANQAATSVEILTNTDGFGIGEFVGAPSSNSWTVEGAEITSVLFISFGRLNVDPFVVRLTWSRIQSRFLFRGRPFPFF